MFYNLVYRIFPHFPIFVNAYPSADMNKKMVLNRLQEAVRKESGRL